MPRLNVFRISVSLEEYCLPYNRYMTNKYRYLVCWLNWIMTRFGFKLEAVVWDCGYRQATSTLPARVFFVPSCTFLYTFWNNIFKLKVHNMDPNIIISFREQSDEESNEFVISTTIIASGGHFGKFEPGFLPTLYWYLQSVIDNVFFTFTSSSASEGTSSTSFLSSETDNGTIPDSKTELIPDADHKTKD